MASMPDHDTAKPGLKEIRAAAERIGAHIHRTQVATSSTLDRELGARIFFKCENFQKVGAFKARGAVNAVLCLSPPEAYRGVMEELVAALRSPLEALVHPTRAAALAPVFVAAIEGSLRLSVTLPGAFPPGQAAPTLAALVDAMLGLTPHKERT